jgi:hypothetical protein
MLSDIIAEDEDIKDIPDIFESRIEFIGDKEVFSVPEVKEFDKVDNVEGCDIDELC